MLGGVRERTTESLCAILLHTQSDTRTWFSPDKVSLIQPEMQPEKHMETVNQATGCPSGPWHVSTGLRVFFHARHHCWFIATLRSEVTTSQQNVQMLVSKRSLLSGREINGQRHDLVMSPRVVFIVKSIGMGVSGGPSLDRVITLMCNWLSSVLGTSYIITQWHQLDIIIGVPFYLCDKSAPSACYWPTCNITCRYALPAPKNMAIIYSINR